MANGSPLALPSKAVGKVMTAKVPIITIGATIADAEKILIRYAKKYDTINYLYVVNTKNKLVGVCSVKDLFTHSKSKKVTNIMKENPVAVHVHTHQQQAAYSALKHNIKAVPVVDKSGVFMGAVTSDMILKILHEESQEDLFRSIGVHRHGIRDNILTIPIHKALMHRLPWLIIGLIGGMVAAKIVGHFEATLENHIILAAFIPLVMYMADAVGTQMEAFVIRDFATNPNIKFAKYFLRQLIVVLLIGIITSAGLIVLSGLFYGNIKIGFVLGIGLFCAIISSVFTGLLIPYSFEKLSLDPANASGPIATIFQDVLSIVIYFLVASWLL